jgi:hypothetical protein
MRAFILYTIMLLSIGQLRGQNVEGVELIEFTQSTCDMNSDPYRIKPRIITMQKYVDTLAIEISFATTCCLEYLPNIKYLSDTLYLTYGIKDEGEACSCICCYSFNYKINGIKSSKLTVKLYKEVIELSDEKYRTYRPTFTIIEGDTLNRKDKYGLKQGIWTDSTTSFSKLKEGKDKVDKHGHPNRDWKIENEYSEGFIRYKDEKIEKRGHIYINLVIKDEYDPKKKVRREFYENGMIKKECDEADDRKILKCRQWKKDGEEIR